MCDYAELIEALRSCSQVNSLSLYKRDLMRKAAGAIEELLAKLDELWIQLHVEGRSLIDDYDFYKRFKMLGNDHIDRPGWERWENELQAERVRRKEETE